MAAFPDNQVAFPPATALNGNETIPADNGTRAVALPVAVIREGLAALDRPNFSPYTLADQEELVITHGEVLNAAMTLFASYRTNETGLSWEQLDFDMADEAEFAQEDAVNGTDFNADGTLTLHDSVSGAVDRLNNQMTVRDFTECVSSGVLGDNPDAYGEYQAYTNIDYNASAVYRRGWLSTTVQNALASVLTDVSLPWIDYIFDAPTLITEYKIRGWSQDFTSSYDARGWVVYGSNDDGTTWVEIDRQTGQTWASETDTKTFTAASPGVYTRVRLIPSHEGAGGANEVGVGGIELRGPTPSYPTDTWYYVTTTDDNHMDLDPVLTINALSQTLVAPANTEIRMLISFDNRATWSKWNGSAWETFAAGLTDPANANTPTEVATGLTGYAPSDGEFFDVAWFLKTTDASVTPSVSDGFINYDGKYRYDAVSVGRYGVAAEVEWQPVTPTTTKIKNNLGFEATIHVSVLRG